MLHLKPPFLKVNLSYFFKTFKGGFTMSNYAVFRVAKLRPGNGKKSIGKCMRHLDNHTKSADISRPERLHLNKTKKYYSDYKEEIRNAIKKHNSISNKKLRSDASIGMEMIFTFSPEQEKNISSQEFYECIKIFIKENFADAQLLRLDYHASESCNHFHAVFLSTTPNGLISSRYYLKDKAHLTHLQDRFAEICKPLGLERGKRYKGQKNKPHNIDLKTHKQKQIKDIENLKKIKNDLKSELCQELSR